MSSTLPQTNDPMSFAVALPLAMSYADLGLSGYNNLARAFEESRESGDPLAWDSNGGIAAAMVMSFAAELFIKCLAFQRLGTYPKGHDFAKLVGILPNDARAGVKARYEAMAATKQSLLKLNYEFLASPAPPPKAPVPPQDDWPGHTFEEAIALTAPLFVKLRYLYEEITIGFSAEIDFRWLIFLIEALRHEIDSYKDGGAKLSWGPPQAAPAIAST